VGPNGDVHDIAGMLNNVVDYYKYLFGSENRLDINLADLMRKYLICTIVC
jgi:hypothetical protein